jgi:hypothetical protein
MNKVSRPILGLNRTGDTLGKRERPRRLQNTPRVMSRIEIEISANGSVGGEGSSRENFPTHKGLQQ